MPNFWSFSYHVHIWTHRFLWYQRHRLSTLACHHRSSPGSAASTPSCPQSAPLLRSKRSHQTTSTGSRAADNPLRWCRPCPKTCSGETKNCWLLRPSLYKKETTGIFKFHQRVVCIKVAVNITTNAKSKCQMAFYISRLSFLCEIFNGILMPLCPFFNYTYHSIGICLWMLNRNWDIS